MKNIVTKQFQILTDINLAWDFIVEIYNIKSKENKESIEAPFFEYALTSSWMNKDYLHLCRFWLDNDKIVAFVFYENLGDIYFVLRPGYEDLAEEMILYASTSFIYQNNQISFIFSKDQKELIQAAEKHGYKLSYQEKEYVLDITKTSLNFELPKGYHFVDAANIDPIKLAKCTWKSFNEWELGPFENWESPGDKRDWNPHKSYTGVQNNLMAPPPHSTYKHNIVIADENEEYVCYSGMWWVPENGLAYMEPLCTIPEHQHKGLAAAALTKHYQKFKNLGGKLLTGGDNDFYKKIGYDLEIYSLVYKKS